MWKFLSFLVIFYFIFKFINRIFRAFLSPHTKSENTTYKRYSNKKTGEVTINHSDKKEKKVDKSEGEYVDFEDIK